MTSTGVIQRLVGVYHADGGLRGELAYLIGKARGTAECALCDVTHGPLGPRRRWRELRAGLGVPVEMVHLNERDAQVRTASEGGTPCLLAITDDGPVLLLGPLDLAAIGGSVDRFGARLRAAVADAGLYLPGS
ncbi:hypothetical protein [Micromonospora siamensis]|uniref:Uncharacterized protein n=1 Tax=Micromonospora siamensis TaxID=299152 RepID=A0A1C5HTK2_9ACTN|nr:hypothetical protein [Micromonospora siamensis]SCG49223.1 hypothetical protein GA0074704_2311 [Micromonospora siamensis]